MINEWVWGPGGYPILMDRGIQCGKIVGEGYRL